MVASVFILVSGDLSFDIKLLLEKPTCKSSPGRTPGQIEHVHLVTLTLDGWRPAHLALLCNERNDCHGTAAA